MCQALHISAMAYDSNGQILVGSLAEYMVPLATDYPVVRAVSLEAHPSPNNPLGAKGAGEGGIIPVGGVLANAVAAALSSFGVQPRQLPLTPPRVWQLIADAKKVHGSRPANTNTGYATSPEDTPATWLKKIVNTTIIIGGPSRFVPPRTRRRRTPKIA